MTTTVRRASDSDATTLAELNRHVQEPHLAERPDYFNATDLDELAEWYREQLGKPTTSAWIAEVDEVPVGYALSLLREREANPFCLARRWREIDQVAVDPAQRRGGVARELIAAAVAEAEAEGISQIELSAWHFNERAREAFARLGFTPMVVRFERRG